MLDYTTGTAFLFAITPHHPYESRRSRYLPHNILKNRSFTKSESYAHAWTIVQVGARVEKKEEEEEEEEEEQESNGLVRSRRWSI